MRMSPRFWPENTAGVLAEITGRTIGARALLTPGPPPRTFNEIIVGVMGRALEVSPLELCACVWTANHYHLLVVAHEQQQAGALEPYADSTRAPLDAVRAELGRIVEDLESGAGSIHLDGLP